MKKSYSFGDYEIIEIGLPAIKEAYQSGLKEISIFDIFRKIPGYTRDELLAMTGFFTSFIQYVESCDERTGMIYLKPSA